MKVEMENAVVLLTGASSGLGVSFAHDLMKMNVRTLILVARRAERLEALAQELHGVRCTSLSSDREAAAEKNEEKEILQGWPGTACGRRRCSSPPGICGRCSPQSYPPTPLSATYATSHRRVGQDRRSCDWSFWPARSIKKKRLHVELPPYLPPLFPSAFCEEQK